MGTVYLIHFDSPFGARTAHARHYLGYTSNLDKRLEDHRNGTGSKLIRHVQNAGITWSVARTWKGDRALERKLKNRKAAPRLCPLCAEERQIIAEALKEITIIKEHSVNYD